MAFNINEFAAQGLKFGGARPSLFSVDVPRAGGGLRFKCFAANLPESTVTTLTPSYFGRQVKIAGTRIFADWSVQIYNDEDFVTRKALEDWSDSIQLRRSVGSVATPGVYRQDATVTQFNKTGGISAIYTFRNLWPTNIGPIDLSWDNGDQIEQYTVAWAYDYWEPFYVGTGGLQPTGASSGGGISGFIGSSGP